MSEVKVNKISPRSGTQVTLGDSSDDFLVPSGAEIQAKSGSNITIDSGATITNNGTATGFPEYDDSVVQSNIAMLGFKVAVNGSLTRYNLVDQSIDEFFDTSGVDASASVNEARSGGAPYYYYGLVPDNPTGGTTNEYSGFVSHTFTATGSFITPSATGNVDVFVVAGGASGGRYTGGGGGAGGYKVSAALAVGASTTFTATVGTGGAAVSISGYGNDGVNSSFAGSGIVTITALKGGAGAGGGGGPHAGTGGCGTYGSGGGGEASGGGGGAGTTGQGYAGGAGGGTYGGSQVSSGGGGGGSAVGANSPSCLVGGAGGAGFANLYKTGVNITYAGGGGGRGVTGGAGGSGGGGAGACCSGAGGTATANTGSGGGGAYNDADSGAGADGIIVIRYTDTEYSVVGDLTLQSTDVTAEAEPDYGEFVTLIENAYGTATLNTDIKGYVSRDSGTTFTQGTLADEGTWGTNKQILGFHDLDISAQPSGTSLCYKITTHNQVPSSKETRIYATSIGWR